MSSWVRQCPSSPGQWDARHLSASGQPPGLGSKMQDFSVASYSALPWHEFFIGTIGAAAALTGLLFVAISINLEQVLKYPQLPGRAAATLALLVSALVVSGFALAPGQNIRVLGAEVVAVAAVAAGQALWVSIGKNRPGEPTSWRIEHVATLVLPSAALVVGGVSLIARSGGGLYWVLAGILFAFVSASINAWVLLVEIKR